MRFRMQQNHMIDFLFPVILLFMFALSSLTVILLAAGVYRSTTEHSSLHDTSRTSLSYISEKIHQSDQSGLASIEHLEGVDMLVLEQPFQGETYCTYIYAYDNELRELFIKKGTPITLSAGRTILPVNHFTMQALQDDLFRFSCTDTQSRQASIIVTVRSTNDEKQQRRAS